MLLEAFNRAGGIIFIIKRSGCPEKKRLSISRDQEMNLALTEGIFLKYTFAIY